jgi:hypothetical protein
MTPEEKEVFAEFGPLMTWFGIATLGGFGLMLGPMPWPAFGLVAVAVALTLAITGRVRVRDYPSAKPTARAFGIGIVFASLMLAYSGLLAVQWPAQWEYQRCQTGALTGEASDACLVAYQRDSQSIIDRIFGDTR